MRLIVSVGVSVQLLSHVVLASAGERFGPHPMDAVAIADCHIHMVDFLQNGGYLCEGREVPPRVSDALPAGSRHLRIELLLWKMERCNISHAAIFAMPFVKKWSEDDPFLSTYYLHSSSRVVRARDTDYTIDDLTNLTLGERPRANHAALFRIYDFAGEHRLPVLLHHNLAPVSHNGLDRGTRYLRELLDAYEEFPRTVFIHCHAGMSRRIVISAICGIGSLICFIVQVLALAM